MYTLDIIVDIATLIGIIIAVFEFHYLRKTTIANNERNQKQATFDFYMSVKDRIYAYNSVIYERYERKLIPYNDIKDDEEFIGVLKAYLNLMELIATGINTGIYNIYVFDRLYGDVCVRVADQLTEYIKNRRAIINEAEIYRDYDLLIESLKKVQSERMGLLNKNAEIKNNVF